MTNAKRTMWLTAVIAVAVAIVIGATRFFPYRRQSPQVLKSASVARVLRIGMSRVDAFSFFQSREFTVGEVLVSTSHWKPVYALETMRISTKSSGDALLIRSYKCSPEEQFIVGSLVWEFNFPKDKYEARQGDLPSRSFEPVEAIYVLHAIDGFSGKRLRYPKVGSLEDLEEWELNMERKTGSEK